jgi:hypothetical protein
MATKETTSSGSSEFFEEIGDVELPEPAASLADDYERLFDDRDRFLWRWIYSLFPAFTLSSVAAADERHVRTQKTVLTMYVTVLDDIVENHDDRATFEEACRLVHDPETVEPSRAEVDPEQFAFIEDCWRTFEDGIEDAPRYDEFADIMAYDMRQTTNAMDYSAVVNQNPRIANLSGSRRYGAHNMVMFPYADVDLMYSPGFELADFSALRDLLWDLQELARIGNWLTTWEREVREGDFTAGIVTHAIQQGIVTPTDLEESPREVVERLKRHDIEGRFRDRWEQQYHDVQTREFDTESIDLHDLVDGMETVFEYHLASRGYK